MSRCAEAFLTFKDIMQFYGVVATVLLLVIGCVDSSEDPSERERQTIITEVERSFDSLAAAAKSLDPDQFLHHFDEPSFSGVIDGRVLSSFDEFESLYREGLPLIREYLSLEFSNVSVRVLNRSTAVLVNEYVETIVLVAGDTLTVSGVGGQVWVRRGNTWRLSNVSGGVAAADTQPRNRQRQGI